MGCTSSKSDDNVERAMDGRLGIGQSERIHKPSERKELAASRAKSYRAGGPPVLPRLDSQGHMIAEEVYKRISGSKESRDVVLGTVGRSDDGGSGSGIVSASYAAMTQRGYYPDDPHKENQDEHCLHPTKFASGDGDAFFAVFDGHGDKGHDCARFARATLPGLLAAQIKRRRAAENAARLRELERDGLPKPKNAFHPSSWPYLSAEGYEECCRAAHVQCNERMHDDKQVKDTLSGTTSISVGFHGGRMTISNVGDSRVVLGHRMSNDRSDSSSTPAEEEEKTEISGDDCDENENDPERSPPPKGGEMVAIPLSEDQTPYRKDERDRLKRAGARVCSIDQMEGIEEMHENWGEVDLGVDIDEHGDPPRVWCADRDYPGTAFSRSLGDSVGEEIGVNAEPECLTKEVTRGDEILVIASDGVFEFLTNQRVIEICAACDDPQAACARLLDESYKRWLHYELRTDDITCVVLFLKNGRPDDRAAIKGLMERRQRIKPAAKASKKHVVTRKETSVVDDAPEATEKATAVAKDTVAVAKETAAVAEPDVSAETEPDAEGATPDANAETKTEEVVEGATPDANAETKTEEVVEGATPDANAETKTEEVVEGATPDANAETKTEEVVAVAKETTAVVEPDVSAETKIDAEAAEPDTNAETETDGDYDQFLKTLSD